MRTSVLNPMSVNDIKGLVMRARPSGRDSWGSLTNGMAVGSGQFVMIRSASQRPRSPRTTVYTLLGRNTLNGGDAPFAGRVVDGQHSGEPVVPAVPDGGTVFRAARRDDDALRILRDGQERASVHVRGNDGLRYRQLQRVLVGQLADAIRVDAAQIPSVEHAQVGERPDGLGGPSDACAHVRANPVWDADAEVLEPVASEIVAATDQVVGVSVAPHLA